MSRSHRQLPICGWTSCASEKEDKRLDHKLKRARVRNLIAHARYDEAVWDAGAGLAPYNRGKDGKMWFDPEEHPQFWRK